MSLFNFQSSNPKPRGKNKSLKIVFGISALAAVMALSSTLAASINLNSGAPVEFGQGIAQTTACDDSVILTPQSTFVNDVENSRFLFTSFSVIDISSSCSGKTLTIKAFKNGQESPLDLYRAGGELGVTYREVKVKENNGSFSFVDGGLLSDDIQDLSTTGFNVELVTGGVPTVALALAQDVDRITIESSEVTESYLSTAASVIVDASYGGGVTGSEWINTGSNGINLFLHGDPPQVSYVSGDGGGNLEFNGNSTSTWQYVTGSYSENASQLHRVTAEFWMKLESEPANDFPHIFTTGSQSSYDINRFQDKVGFNTWNDDLYGFDASIYMGSWHHYVFVLSDGARDTQKIYVDGVEKNLTSYVNENSANRNFPTNGAFSAFFNVGMGGYYPAHGFVGGMRIYPGELPLASIQANYNYYDSRL